MRITISHTKPKEEVMRSVDRGLDDLFRGIGGVPLQFVDEKRQWNGSTLDFTVKAKMGLLTAPIRGKVEVTDKDLTVEVDLGLLGRLISPAQARESISSRVRGLLT